MQHDCKYKFVALMDTFSILRTHNLRRTACREGILKVIMTSGKALSESEIRSNLSGNFDRTTFYRSFKTMEDSGILHKIVVDDRMIRYGLSESVTGKSSHPHFYCTSCHSVFCLEDSLVAPQLPAGYSSQNLEMIVKGVCKKCNA